MKNLRKIGDVASEYGITGRTLRYYEEIGLMKSVRAIDSRYRYYGEESLKRLEEILTLKKFEISMKNLHEVLSSRKASKFVEVFFEKLESINDENRRNEELKTIIGKFLDSVDPGTDDFEKLFALLRKSIETLPCGSGCEEREGNSMEKETKDLTDEEVRIVKLLPMKTAWYRAESETPETDAWKVMLEWVKSKGLEKLSATRYFGFNNPNPSKNSSVYGYEVWVTVPEGTEPDGKVGVKDFEGGLYAVTATFLYDIGKRWSQLAGWAKKNGREATGGRWLEEHIFIDETWGTERMQLDLHLPVKE